jgi:hypothetical protein
MDDGYKPENTDEEQSRQHLGVRHKQQTQDERNASGGWRAAACRPMERTELSGQMGGRGHHRLLQHQTAHEHNATGDTFGHQRGPQPIHRSAGIHLTGQIRSSMPL